MKVNKRYVMWGMVLYGILFGIGLMLLLISPLNAQTDSLNHAKYWKYKDRLLGNGTVENPGFVDIGIGPGKSLPITGRNPETVCREDYSFQVQICPIPEGKGKIRWGDGTITLGYYLGTLATEYALLYRNNRDTRGVHQELSWALDAYVRLDTIAETFYGEKGKLDGFFIRSDVPGNFLIDDDGVSPRFPGYSCMLSGIACRTPDIKEGSFTSQDQAIHMLFGLSFVAKILPDIPEAKALSTRAVRISETIITFLKDNKWKVEDPNGEIAMNKWGGDAIAYSWLLAKSCREITESEEGAYQTGRSRTLGSRIWDMLVFSFNQQRDDNQSMALELLAISNQWSIDRLAKKAVVARMEVFPLAHAILHDLQVGKAIERESLKEMLDLAPIDGPCFNTPGCPNAPGWKYTNRWIKPKYAYDDMPFPNHHEWNGLDYMLFYNLYHLYYLSEMPYGMDLD